MRVVDGQREVDGRRVEAEVEQSLGEVHGRLLESLVVFQLFGRGDEFVHAAIAVRHRQEVLHAAEQVVGVEHGVFRHVPQSVGAVRADVAVGADQHAHVAEEGAHATDRLRAVVVQEVPAHSPSLADRRGAGR